MNDHDFRSQAEGIAIPYGIYDLQANRGSVVIGTSTDTPWFATDCLALWYAEEGQKRYPDTTELLILATAAAATGLAVTSGNMACRLSYATVSALALRFAITRRELPSGTPLSTAYSARSARTGRDIH